MPNKPRQTFEKDYVSLYCKNKHEIQQYIETLENKNKIVSHWIDNDLRYFLYLTLRCIWKTHLKLISNMAGIALCISYPIPNMQYAVLCMNNNSNSTPLVAILLRGNR